MDLKTLEVPLRRTFGSLIEVPVGGKLFVSSFVIFALYAVSFFLEDSVKGSIHKKIRRALNVVILAMSGYTLYVGKKIAATRAVLLAATLYGTFEFALKFLTEQHAVKKPLKFLRDSVLIFFFLPFPNKYVTGLFKEGKTEKTKKQ